MPFANRARPSGQRSQDLGHINSVPGSAEEKTQSVSAAEASRQKEHSAQRREKKNVNSQNGRKEDKEVEEV